MNEFSLVKGADAEVLREIQGWTDKIEDYLRDLFDGNIERVRGTRCFGKLVRERGKVNYIPAKLVQTMTQQLSDEEIINKQERLYELERDCSTGPRMTEEEKMQRIRALLAEDYWEKLLVKAEARRKELEQEILTTSNPKKKERIQRNIELLSTYKNLPPDFGVRRKK